MGRMNRTGVVLVALAVAALAGCAESGDATAELSTPSATPSPTVDNLEISGVVAVSPTHAIADDATGTCMAWGEFTDFNGERLQVVVADSSGATVAIADADPAEVFQDGCIRAFTATVPAGGEFYSATVGDWASETYAEADLATTTLAVVIDG